MTTAEIIPTSSLPSDIIHDIIPDDIIQKAKKYGLGIDELLKVGSAGMSATIIKRDIDGDVIDTGIPDWKTRYLFWNSIMERFIPKRADSGVQMHHHSGNLNITDLMKVVNANTIC